MNYIVQGPLPYYIKSSVVIHKINHATFAKKGYYAFILLFFKIKVYIIEFKKLIKRTKDID
jgi:hypothetical protein